MPRAPPNWNYLKLHHPEGMTTGDTVTLTLTFSQAVTGLTLTITDIDKDVELLDRRGVGHPRGLQHLQVSEQLRDRRGHQRCQPLHAPTMRVGSTASAAT